jgi:hypothetical protein
VLLSLLGVFEYGNRYGSAGAPNQKASTDNPITFTKQTGKTLGGKFRKYWETHGGLMQQGYPISDEFQEVSALNGKTYTVQYFQRAVFEWHPENQAPYKVLLSQLGTFRLRTKYPSGLAPGVWGGDHIALFANDSGATVEFDCAHGSINLPVVVDSAGRFDATGVFVREHGGPTFPDQPEDSHPARYTGITDGSTMTLTITLTDSNQTIGTYVLFHGKVTHLVKCL